MTNTQIILIESVKLMEAGIIDKSPSGNTITTVDGRKLDMPEPIHTYAVWKNLGYKVKQGEKAIAQFPIWKYTSKKIKDEETDEEIETGKCHMRTASFFKKSQVEKVVK